jgi:hypothetical protein
MRLKDMIAIAKTFAINGDNRRDYLLGAVGERGDGAVVFARNEATQIRTPEAHAEFRLCSKLGLYAPLVIVVRVSKLTGELTLSKPCSSCEKMLRRSKVCKVIYSTDQGMERLW